MKKQGVCKRVGCAATKLLDEKLMAKLSEGDLVPTGACYHNTCYTTEFVFSTMKSLQVKREMRYWKEWPWHR